jgi:hypothetical protein
MVERCGKPVRRKEFYKRRNGSHGWCAIAFVKPVTGNDLERSTRVAYEGKKIHDILDVYWYFHYEQTN